MITISGARLACYVGLATFIGAMWAVGLPIVLDGGVVGLIPLGLFAITLVGLFVMARHDSRARKEQ